MEGFTLTEILVVVGILFALIALALPAYQKVNETAKVTKDLSNLRQIGTAIVLYANDNGYIPGEQWPMLLEPTYLTDLDVCQSPFDKRSTNEQTEATPVSYDVNVNLWGSDMLSIVSPTNCLLLAPLTNDTPTPSFLSTSEESSLPSPLSSESDGSDASGGTCSNGSQIPVLFADLHAAVIPMSVFHAAKRDPADPQNVADILWNY
jgi:type II secretory pathway pseudopilin PulG